MTAESVSVVVNMLYLSVNFIFLSTIDLRDFQEWCAFNELFPLVFQLYSTKEEKKYNRKLAYMKLYYD